MKFFCTIFYILFLCTYLCHAQVKDTVISSQAKDSILDTAKKLSPKNVIDSSINITDQNTNQNLPAIAFKPTNYTWLFYSIVFLFLLFGLIKTYYQHYFDTLIRVLFNTTLKQNQLTDQLEQAKQPSLIFNLLFVVLAGVYTFTLIEFLGDKKLDIANIKIKYLLTFILIVGICYAVKYITLLFVGWLTNLNQEIKSYIFIVFLLNKVLGISLLILLPFIFFGSQTLSSFAVLVSIVAVVLSFLLRYARSFAPLKSKINLNVILFLLFVFCLEVMPLGIIFKFCSMYLNTKA